MKKLLIALGLSSALLATPVLAQTDQTAPPAAGTDASAPAGDMAKKPMKAKTHHKAKPHKAMKKMSPAKEAPADANAPKS